MGTIGLALRRDPSLCSVRMMLRDRRHHTVCDVLPSDQLKQQLAAHIARVMDGWNQTDGAYRIGIRQGELSELLRGRLERFSIERLIDILGRLHQVIELQLNDPKAIAFGRRQTVVRVVAFDRFGHPLPAPQPPRARRRPRVTPD